VGVTAAPAAAAAPGSIVAVSSGTVAAALGLPHPAAAHTTASATTTNAHERLIALTFLPLTSAAHALIGSLADALILRRIRVSGLWLKPGNLS